MKLGESLLPEFDQEMANTRKTLERIPDDKLDWKAHEKSFPMGGLSTHLANIPSWAVMTISEDSLDIAPPGVTPSGATLLKSVKEILDTFDKNVAAARDAIAGASDEQLFKPWSLLKGGNVIMTLPKIAVLRGFVLSHTIHHRAQLGVYLRLLDIPVPSIYGPSADEGAF